MDNLYEMIKKANDGDAEAQYNVAWYIVWEDKREPIDPDWLERAIDYFERAASQGHGDAMLDLGAMYRVGRGVVRDMEKAFYWYNKAAEILHPKAFRCLGYALEIPLGYLDINDPLDNEAYKTAFNYFFKGAMLDEQNSLFQLGDMYFAGKFVDIDKNYAFRLYKKSFDLIEYIEDDSYASVCLRLGECYCMGIGTEQDIDKAREHLENAIKGFEVRIGRGDDPQFFMEGYNRAKHFLKRIESNKIPGIPVDLALIKRNEEYDAFVAGEQANFPEPQYPIEALETLKAENPKVPIPKGEDFITVLAKAESGDYWAMYYLAFYCIDRFENEPDNKDMINFALYYYHKAASSGFSVALYAIGCVFSKGEGVTPDHQKALLYFERSNQTIAEEKIGRCYLNGDCVEQDYERAFKCFVKCALFRKSYDYAALPELAYMYREGIFVEADKKFADYLEEQGKKCGESGREYEKG